MFGRKRSGGKTTEERSTVAHEIVASVQTDKGCVGEINEDSGRLVRPADESRLYMLRGGKVYQLTEDHSAVMEMVKLGLITKEEARHHDDKNVILRALGTSPEVEVSILEPFSVRAGDQYLLCSDGLYDLVPDEEIEHELSNAGDIQAAGQKLITLAKERGGHDNITVGIVAVVAAGASAAGAVDMRATREWRAQG